MIDPTFKAEHLNATAQDFMGNGTIGRYVFLPGSDGRAKEIAEHFEDLTIKPHPRMHNLYLGSLDHEGHKIQVAAIASGMGCPSMEIILHELYHLGAKRFLRIGTSGSLQPSVHVGDLVNAQASVRDENTACHYVPLEFPAIASLEFTSSILLAADHLKLTDILHTGVVHCKSSLFAREFGEGPRSLENKAYMELLTRAGVLVSEMETATLFIQAQIYNHQEKMLNRTPNACVLAGAILNVVDGLKNFDHSRKMPSSIALGLETIKILATQELIG